jgi:PAS domain S-box-containing protein
MSKIKNVFLSLKFIILSLGLLILFIGGTYIYQKETSRNLRNQAYTQLKAISQLKSKEISAWYSDEIYDAKIIANNFFLQEEIYSFLSDSNFKNKARLIKFLNEIENEHGLDGIYIINQNKKILIESLNNNESNFGIHRILIGNQDSVFTTEIHINPITKRHCIDFIAPLSHNNKSYFIVFENNIDSFLFPLISNWPTESKTAETLLIQREMDSVIIVSPIKGEKGKHIKLMLSIYDTERPAVQAALGKIGIFRGIDYRNKQVLSYLQDIEGTPWKIVSKIDEDELYKELYKNAVEIFLYVFIIIGFVVFSIAFLYANRQRKIYKNLFKIQQHFKTTLYSIGDGVITTDKKGRVQYVNHIAENLTGWSEKEAQGKLIHEVFNIINVTTREVVKNPVDFVLFENEIGTLDNNIILINKKDNSEIPISDSGAPIKNEEGEIIGVVLVFRDQTEEYEYKKSIVESNRKMSTLLSNLPGVAYSCLNNSDWDMLFISEACIDLTGYPYQEFINKNITFGSLIHPEDRQYVFDEIQNAFANKATFKIEYRIITKQQEEKWVWEQGQGVFSDKGNLQSIEGYIVDITFSKHIQQELANSNQILQLILDTIPTRVFWKDLNLNFLGGNIAYLNDAGFKNTTELIGKNDFDFNSNELSQKFRDEEFELLRTGIPQYNIEESEIKDNRIIRWFKTNKIPLLDTQGNVQGLLGMYEDITNQKMLLEELYKSEELHRNLFQNIGAIIIIIDMSDGKIFNVNNAAVKFYGWSVEEFKSMNIADIDTLNSFDLIVDFLQNETTPHDHFEVQHKKADGSLCIVEVFPTPIFIDGKEYYQSMIYDITDKKEAEKQITLQIRAIEQSPVSIVITNPKGDIEYVNPKFCAVTGYSFQEAIGKNPSILKSGSQNKEFYKILWDTITIGKDWIGELHNKKKNGELYWEQALISPIVNSKNEITHFVAVKEDITEKKKMLEDLIVAKEKAEESDKLKSAFLANMSHEIRTPMNGIIGFSEMLTDPILEEDKRQEYAKIVVNSSKQLLSIVNDILDISRIEAGEINISVEKFMINQLLQEVFLFFKPQTVKKGIHLELENAFSDTDCYIETDKNRLRQVIINLVSNAIKFTHEGKVIFGYTATKDTLEFYVKDTGIGIAKQMQVKIFERFRQAELDISKQYGGTGLGLSISQKLVRLLGGEIDVESEIGKGSIFSFTLPYNEKNQNKITVTNLNIDFKKATILIAEDNETNYQLLEATLAKNNVTLYRAKNGKEAIQICSENYEITFVLMDLRMPLIDGISAAIEIKKTRPDLPIVIQSAYKMEEEKQNAMDAGCDDYLSKPIKKQDLIQCLSKFIMV